MSLDRMRRIARALAPELDHMMEQLKTRIAGYDDVVFDKVAQSAIYSKEGRAIWRARFEIIGRYSRDLGLFRWWWVGRPPTASEARMDTAYGEAQRLELQALLDKQVVVESEEDALHLARLAAHLAGADGVINMEEEREGDDLKVAYYALFDSWHGSQKRPSFSSAFAVSKTMPPPASIPAAPRVPQISRPPTPMAIPLETPISRRPTAAAASPPPSAHSPPAAHGPPPSLTPGALREPARALIDALVPSLSQALANYTGFRQALLVVSVDTQGEKARFFTQIVLQNERGDLEAIETTRAVLDAVAALIAEDARSGNARWRRLSIRFWRDQNMPAVEHVSVL